jgi:predicted MPP superfamily phosphohydrolase
MCKKAIGRTPGFYFVQMADCQFGMLKKDKSWVEEQESLLQALQKVNRMEPKPEFVTMCGDLVNAYPERRNIPVRKRQTSDLKRAIKTLRKDVPFVCVCGNHDIGNTPTSDSIQEWKGTWGDDYFSFVVQDCRFIVLNSQLFKDPSQVEAHAREQRIWLEQQLEEEKVRSAPCIIFSHIPPFIKSASEAESWANWPVSARKEVLDLAKAAGVSAWFAGHYHQNAGGHDDGLEVVVTSAVGSAIDSQGADFSQVG